MIVHVFSQSNKRKLTAYACCKPLPAISTMPIQHQ